MSLFALICLISSFTIYSSYLGYIRIKYKPYCISDSYYKLSHKSLFTAWIILISFLIFPAWVEISPIYFQFLPFLSVITLSLVGLFPKYLEQDRIPHITGAIVTCILSIIWNIVSGVYIVPLVLGIILVLICVIKVKDELFWIECLAFLNIYLSILLS